MELGWILKNIGTVQGVIASVLSEETAEDIKALSETLQDGKTETFQFAATMEEIIKKGIAIAIDVMKEPLEAAGFDLPVTRAIVPEEAEIVKARLTKIYEDVIPYDAD